MKPARLPLWLWAVCLLTAAWNAWAAPDQVVDVPTRRGVTQRFIWTAPDNARASVLLLVGGNGGLRIGADGKLGALGGNFLARSRTLFVEQGLAVALVDAPSDRQSPPYLAGFRQTPEHAADLKAVVAEMRKRLNKPVVLVGTSRGTQSAAAVALQLPAPYGPDALVLTSTILTDPTGRAVTKMPLEQLRIPVLVVHHQNDGCKLCAYSDFPLLTTHLPASHQVRTYQGGVDEGDPCDAQGHHGFKGLETRVVQDIAQWIFTTLAP